MARDVVLFRSGRHLATAVDALRRLWPDCRVLVVSQPGTEMILDQLRIAPEDRFIFRERRFFSPLAVACSPAGRALRRRGYDEVALLWTDPFGKGFANVNRTALWFSPSGFLAVTPDGKVLRQRTLGFLKWECLRTLGSLATLLSAGLLLYLPAALLRRVRR